MIFTAKCLWISLSTARATGLARNTNSPESRAPHPVFTQNMNDSLCGRCNRGQLWLVDRIANRKRWSSERQKRSLQIVGVLSRIIVRIMKKVWNLAYRSLRAYWKILDMTPSEIMCLKVGVTRFSKWPPEIIEISKFCYLDNIGVKTYVFEVQECNGALW